MGKTITRLLEMGGIEVASNDLIPIQDVSEPKTKAISFEELNKALVRLANPIGSILTMIGSANPNTIYPGTIWVQDDTWIDRQLIATKTLHWSTGDVTASTTKQRRLGVYNYYMLEDMLISNTANTEALGLATIPTGYHVEYKMTAEVSTSTAVSVGIFLNNIESNKAGTYSGNTLRRTVSTDFFKRTDIVLETTTGYSQPGINFGWVADANAGAIRIYLPTLSAYLVKDTPDKRWRRTA